MDPMTMMAIGQGLGGVMGMFGGQSQGAGYDQMAKEMQKAMEEQRRLTGQANDLIRPWYDAGKSEMPGYMKNYQQLMNPQFINQLMGDYKQSNYAGQQMRSGQDAITNAASASGQLGSGQFGKDMGNYAQDITSRDQQSYVDRLLNQYNLGLGHQGNMVGQGGSYGSQMGQNLIGMGDRNMQAMMGAQNARMQGNQARQGGWGALASGAMGMLGGMGGMGGMPMAQQAAAPLTRLF